MTRNELFQLFQGLTGSDEATDELFDAYLDIAQATFEQSRPWVILHAEDATQTVTGATTLTTAFNLPSDFNRWYDPKRSVQLVSTPDFLRIWEIPAADRFNQQFINNRFFGNYALGKLYFTGTFAKSYTLYQFYIKDAPLVSEHDGSGNYLNEWIFPEKFQKYLALAAAVYWKLGADYDLINNSQGNQHAAMAKMLMNSAADWDDDLQRMSLQGLNTFGSPDTHGLHQLPPDWANE